MERALGRGGACATLGPGESPREARRGGAYSDAAAGGGGSACRSVIPANAIRCWSRAGPGSSARTSSASSSPPPSSRVVVLDKLTYAGSLRNLDECLSDPRLHFVQADICDRPGARRSLPGAPAGPRRELRRRDPCRPLDRRARRVRPDQPRGHLRAARGRALRLPRARGGRAKPLPLPPRLDRRGLRLARRRRDSSTKRRPTRRTRPTPRARPARTISSAPISTPTACPSLITNCSNNYGPYQFPEKLIPLMMLNARRGPASADLRRRRQRARLALRRGPLRGDPAGTGARADRREVQHRRRQRAHATSRSSIGSATRSSGSCRRGRTLRCERRGPRPTRTSNDSSPTGPDTTGATPSTRPGSAGSSAGSRATTSKPGSNAPWPGTSRTATGAKPSRRHLSAGAARPRPTGTENGR